MLLFLLSKAITDPLTEHVVQVNKSIITLIAQSIPLADEASMIKVSGDFPYRTWEPQLIIFTEGYCNIISWDFKNSQYLL